MADYVISSPIMEIANKYAGILKKEFNIHCVYLFGSHTKGTESLDSDIDIAVVAEDLTGDLYEDTIKLMKYRRLIDSRIEPHPFLISEFNEQNPFAKEIMATGTRIMWYFRLT